MEHESKISPIIGVTSSDVSGPSRCTISMPHWNPAVPEKLF